MAKFAYATTTAIVFLILLPLSCSSESILHHHHHGGNSSVQKSDVDLLEFPLNLEYLEAEFFLYGSLGYGLDKVYPSLAQGGPSPIGAKKAHLDHFTRDVIEQFGWQEVGHLRAIKKTVKGFPRPLLNISAASFAHLVAGLLGVESGQDAVIRALLYQRAELKVEPYGITVAEFTNRISELRNKLGHEGLKDEGLVVPKHLGAEGKVSGNILVGDEYSLACGRTPEEILRIVYGSGNEHVPGSFYPKGADGRIAKSYLKNE
ncbi:hypothetical protein DVH24_025338 [Malus domestica]|uniref:Desiccation-related protein PCC13-62 n=1 Tax=Malus domestica TaxID=3750 RepID=A0A498HQX3_MALDO|nr:hypothetical protein DVH24_025338 [Malus domestica]